MLSKTEEPKIDEIWLFDLLLNHDVVKHHLRKGSFHVIDFNMEFEKDTNNSLFPEYSTPLARFFNTDNNCTTGWMKLGDLETGSLVTVYFKTMPYSANHFNYADPFLVYDMTAEIVHAGEVERVQLVNPDDVLASKKIFVPLF